MTEDKEAIAKPKEKELIVFDQSVKDLKANIARVEQAKKLLGEFIERNLVKGVDYGTIKYTNKRGQKVETKPFLFKPGGEKFAILFSHRPEFEWLHTDYENGNYVVRCRLMDTSGAVVGEGHGAASRLEKSSWGTNEAMKIAEKRAQIDAALRTYGLSEYFTQDEEVVMQELVHKERKQELKEEDQPLEYISTTPEELEAKMAEVWERTGKSEK